MLQRFYLPHRWTDNLFSEIYFAHISRLRRSDWYRETRRDASFIAFRASFSGRRLRERVRFLGKSNIVLIYLLTSRRRMKTRSNVQKIAGFKHSAEKFSKKSLYTQLAYVFLYTRIHTDRWICDVYFFWEINLLRLYKKTKHTYMTYFFVHLSKSIINFLKYSDIEFACQQCERCQQHQWRTRRCT